VDLCRRAVVIALLSVASMLLGGCRLERRDAAALPEAVSDTLVMPTGPLGAAVVRGRAIANATRDSLPQHVGNALRCTSCHLDDARRPNAAPWIGVTARFPQYRSRSGMVLSIEDRINGCLERSLNGAALPLEDARLRALSAYMAWLSSGVRVGDSVPGMGFLRLAAAVPDAGRGKQLYAARCARCHGADGGGGTAPAVWGPDSYNIGAGMARQSIAAGFIQANMPHDEAGSLTVQQAHDVAAFINSRPRPDFIRKGEDWPNGDPPTDAAYPTTAGRRAPA